MISMTASLHACGWGSLRSLVETELTQSAEEGKDPAALEGLRAEFDAAGEDRPALESLHARLLALPLRPDFPFEEPSDLEGIRRLRPNPPALPAISRDDERLADQMHGAWLGRCAGCALGKPVEGFMPSHNGLASWQRQKNYLTAISPGEWPLADYFPEHSPAESETGQVCCQASTREHIAFMETDDDIRYTVLGQMILQDKGRNFTTGNVADYWFTRLPYRQVCTAETQAYRNLVLLGVHSDLHREDYGIDWAWVATHLNPYREWIGAQIRVDSYGYAVPGNPELAAEFAWRDARVSHVKNGIYGAMFCAAMIAASFATPDPRLIIEAGLAQIPATSRLCSEMRQTIGLCEKHGCRFDAFEKVLEDIYALLGHYHPVHTNNNAALCVAALLLSKGDFHQGITLAVMGGWDTDCNGATVGSMVGAICGGKKAPAHWTARLNDTLNSQIPGYHPIAISECARRSHEIARALLSMA
jgi:ADP-ribosylglycohydrolase